MNERPPYRPCPMCRTQLEEIIRQDTAREWKYYECPNCGSAVYINPFLRVKEGKVS